MRAMPGHCEGYDWPLSSCSASPEACSTGWAHEGGLEIGMAKERWASKNCSKAG